MKEFLLTINHFEFIAFRNRCVNECRITRTTWSKWINGGKLTQKNKEDVDRIAIEMFGRLVFGQEGGAK